VSVKQDAPAQHAIDYGLRASLLGFAYSFVAYYAIIFGADSPLEPPCGQNMTAPDCAIKQKNGYGFGKLITVERYPKVFVVKLSHKLQRGDLAPVYVFPPFPVWPRISGYAPISQAPTIIRMISQLPLMLKHELQSYLKGATCTSHA
jgi:hypothetical protein